MVVINAINYSTQMHFDWCDYHDDTFEWNGKILHLRSTTLNLGAIYYLMKVRACDRCNLNTNYFKQFVLVLEGSYLSQIPLIMLKIVVSMEI